MRVDQAPGLEYLGQGSTGVRGRVQNAALLDPGWLSSLGWRSRYAMARRNGG